MANGKILVFAKLKTCLLRLLPALTLSFLAQPSSLKRWSVSDDASSLSPTYCWNFCPRSLQLLLPQTAHGKATGDLLNDNWYFSVYLTGTCRDEKTSLLSRLSFPVLLTPAHVHTFHITLPISFAGPLSSTFGHLPSLFSIFLIFLSWCPQHP